MITIVDYGMGNQGSLLNMLKYLGWSAEISSEIKDVERADKIILPGVGAFDAAIRNLEDRKLRSILLKKAREDKVPFLGICLGMQLLTRGSEEGTLPGLNLIPAATVKFNTDGLKIPHMGWNYVKSNSPSVLTSGFTEEFRFYFVHSYKVMCDDPNHSILKSDYGGNFDAAIQRENIFGTQFHPEKSHHYGLHLFSNFLKI